MAFYGLMSQGDEQHLSRSWWSIKSLGPTQYGQKDGTPLTTVLAGESALIPRSRPLKCFRGLQGGQQLISARRPCLPANCVNCPLSSMWLTKSY